jgi:hypothetical protein
VQFRAFGDEGEKRGWKEAVETFAGQTGWDAAGAGRPGVDWSLDLRAEATGASWTLRDPDGKVVRSGMVRGGPGGRLIAVAELFRQIHNPLNAQATRE